MRLRTVGLKLTLALAGLIAAALAIVYVAVVPSLKARLVDGRLDQLDHAAPLVIKRIEQREPIDGLDPVLQDEGQDRGLRLVVFEQLKSGEPPLVMGDTRQLGQGAARDPVANRAAESLRTERGVVERDGKRYAEVATPFALGTRVLLVAAPLEDTYSTIGLVERRLLAAGLIALVAAALVGFALARRFARRIRRLERGAHRIAAGHFDEPVVDTGADELGELAAAFDDMRKRLAALERARREFIANASHELRTPIFALGGHLELLTDEDVDEDTRRGFLEEMRAQVERLAKLTTDLLDLTRLDAGRLRVELAAVDLTELAGSLVGEFGALGRGTDHVLVVDGDGGAVALADEERVRQIGRILIENALVHTPPGTEVRVVASSNGTTAELRVEDDGPGIALDDQSHVFERFYRADGAVAAGSGLGLAIAQELAAVMGGEIKLSSTGASTIFTLRLPRAQVTAGEREPALSR